MHTAETAPPPVMSRRIHIMDELRGLAIVLMVFYHGFYTLGYLYDLAWGRTLFLFFMPVEPLFAGVFVFLCGASCRLSHSNVRRGVLLLGVAVVISLVMWLFLPDEMIWFGILHFLAVAILLFALLRPLLDRLPPLAGLLACALLLAVTWHVPRYQGGVLGIPGLLSWTLPAAVTQNNALIMLGFGNWESADYFPLIPWLFCFLGGSCFGVWAKQNRLPRWMYPRRVPFLSWAGRHSLIIYVIHQPIIFGAAYAVNWLLIALG